MIKLDGTWEAGVPERRKCPEILHAISLQVMRQVIANASHTKKPSRKNLATGLKTKKEIL